MTIRKCKRQQQNYIPKYTMLRNILNGVHQFSFVSLTNKNVCFKNTKLQMKEVVEEKSISIAKNRLDPIS